jgi:hypothetical protein
MIRYWILVVGAIIVTPVLLRVALFFRYWAALKKALGKDSSRDSVRSVVGLLAGFSFSSLVALMVLDDAVQIKFERSILFLIVSFLSYLSAMNLQGLKLRRWHDEVATGFIESGSFSLILSLGFSLLDSGLPWEMSSLVFFIGCSLLLFDVVVRLTLMRSYLSRVQARLDRASGG